MTGRDWAIRVIEGAIVGALAFGLVWWILEHL